MTTSAAPALSRSLTDSSLEPIEASLLGLRQLDQRVADVAFRLKSRNVDLCRRLVTLTGITPHGRSQYGHRQRAVAERLFGLDQIPAVLVVGADSAAAKAGIKRDDKLIAIGGRDFPELHPVSDAGSFSAIEDVLEILESTRSDIPVSLTLVRDGRRMTIALPSETGCASRVQVVPSRKFGASADGTYIQITSRLVEFSENENDLAAVLAHELAHNILDHRIRLDAANIDRGLLKYFGRNARLIRQTEVEADELSVYLLDRAGYPPEAAARLWQRLGPERPWGIFGSTTHPSWKARVKTLEFEAERLARLKKDDQTPVPPLMRQSATRSACSDVASSSDARVCGE